MKKENIPTFSKKEYFAPYITMDESRGFTAHLVKY